MHSPAGQYSDSKNLSARATLHARFSTNPKGWVNWLFEQFELRGASSILELGAGPGAMWRDRLTSIPADCRLVLSDSSRGMVSEAKGMLQDERIAFELMDAQAIPFADDTFDCVIANHMLYHVPDLGAALSGIARVLKPGGKLYAATNGSGHMRELHDIIRRFVPDFRRMSESFTLDGGAAMLQEHFTDVVLRRYDDALVVPDASALSAYVRSMGSLSGTAEEELSDMDLAISEKIERHGHVKISKDAGVFIAGGPGKAKP